MKIPVHDLESRVLLVAGTALLFAALPLMHLIRISNSGEISLLLCLAILLANLVVSGRHAATGTALSFLSFEMLCWMHPPAGNSIPAAAFHNFLLAFFGLGFALYGFGAIYACFRSRSNSATSQRTLQTVESLLETE